MEECFPLWEKRWFIGATVIAAVVATVAAIGSVILRAHGVLVILAFYLALFLLTTAAIQAVKRMRRSDALLHRRMLAEGTATPTILEFRSPHFTRLPDEPKLSDGGHGASLASFVAQALAAEGWNVEDVDAHDGDAWRIELTDTRLGQSIRIGCSSVPEQAQLFRVSILPSAPYVRSWLRRVSTRPAVEPLGKAIYTILLRNKTVKELRRLTGPEELERFGKS